MMNILKLAILTLATGLLSSCTVADPLFLQNAGKVSDIGYSPNKIVGTWAHVSIPIVQTNSDQIERKLFLSIYPNGKGRAREVVINRTDNGRLSAEATFSWTYQGKNWWTVTLPGTAAYKVTDSYRMRRGSGPQKGPTDIRLRYYNGDLYDFHSKRILVPANASSVSELANRIRGATPTYRIDTTR